MSGTNEIDASSDPADAGQPEAPVVPPVAATDWFLQSLVDFANDHGTETGVTLQIGGLLVSGTIIPGMKYFEEFASLYGSGFKNDPELGAEYAKLIGSYKKYLEVPPEDKDNKPLPQYIHLRNARFFAPGQQQPFGNEGVLWRGRITAVGGFFLGTLLAGAA